jgi:cell wall assembly regulator SMI1
MSEERAELAASSWRNVVAWCRENAPVTAETLRGPASEEVLAAAQAEMGYDWPPDLLAYLRAGDGARRTIHADVILGFIPMGVDQIMSDWRLMRDVINGGEWLEPGEVEASEAGEAGTYCGVWCRTFIPVGDYTTGDFLFIDLRSGPLHGCIREWEDGAAYPREPEWDSVASMLADIDEGLHTGRRDNRTGKMPTVEEGALKWKRPDQDW